MSHLDDLFQGLPPRLSVAQTAELLGVSETTIYTWLAQGVLPGNKVGGKWMLITNAVKEVVASGSNLPTPPNSDDTPVGDDAPEADRG